MLAKGPVERIGEAGGGPADHTGAMVIMTEALAAAGADLRVGSGRSGTGSSTAAGLSDPAVVDDAVVARSTT